MTQEEILDTLEKRYLGHRTPLMAFDNEVGYVDLECDGSRVRVRVGVMPSGIIILNVSDIIRRDEEVPCHDVIGTDLDGMLIRLDEFIADRYQGAWCVRSNHVSLQRPEISDAFYDASRREPATLWDLKSALGYVGIDGDVAKVISVSNRDIPVDINGVLVRRANESEATGTHAGAICLVEYVRNENPRDRDYGHLKVSQSVELFQRRHDRSRSKRTDVNIILKAIREHDEPISMDLYGNDVIRFRHDGMTFRAERHRWNEYEFDLQCEETHETCTLMGYEDWKSFDDAHDSRFYSGERDENEVEETFRRTVTSRLAIVSDMTRRNAVYVDHQNGYERVTWYSATDVDSVPLPSSRREDGEGREEREWIPVGRIPEHGWTLVSDYPIKSRRVEAHVTLKTPIRADIEMRSMDDGKLTGQWKDEVLMVSDR